MGYILVLSPLFLYNFPGGSDGNESVCSAENPECRWLRHFPHGTVNLETPVPCHSVLQVNGQNTTSTKYQK